MALELYLVDDQFVSALVEILRNADLSFTHKGRVYGLTIRAFDNSKQMADACSKWSVSGQCAVLCCVFDCDMTSDNGDQWGGVKLWRRVLDTVRNRIHPQGLTPSVIIYTGKDQLRGLANCMSVAEASPRFQSWGGIHHGVEYEHPIVGIVRDELRRLRSELFGDHWLRRQLKRLRQLIGANDFTALDETLVHQGVSFRLDELFPEEVRRWLTGDRSAGTAMCREMETSWLVGYRDAVSLFLTYFKYDHRTQLPQDRRIRRWYRFTEAEDSSDSGPARECASKQTCLFPMVAAEEKGPNDSESLGSPWHVLERYYAIPETAQRPKEQPPDCYGPELLQQLSAQCWELIGSGNFVPSEALSGERIWKALGEAMKSGECTCTPWPGLYAELKQMLKPDRTYDCALLNHIMAQRRDKMSHQGSALLAYMTENAASFFLEVGILESAFSGIQRLLSQPWPEGFQEGIEFHENLAGRVWWFERTNFPFHTGSDDGHVLLFDVGEDATNRMRGARWIDTLNGKGADVRRCNGLWSLGSLVCSCWGGELTLLRATRRANYVESEDADRFDECAWLRGGSDAAAVSVERRIQLSNFFREKAVPFASGRVYNVLAWPARDVQI